MTTKRTWYADRQGRLPHAAQRCSSTRCASTASCATTSTSSTKLLVDGGARPRRRGPRHPHGRDARDPRPRGDPRAPAAPARSSRSRPTGTSRPATAWRSRTARASALKDMEFVQYHPTGLPGTGILITEASRGEGGYVRNKRGRALPGDARLRRRQQGRARPARHDLARDHARDRRPGAASRAPTASTCTSTSPTSARRRSTRGCPFVRELSTTYVGVDPVYEPIPIRPVVHYMMGGVDTDIDGATLAAGPLRRRRVRLRLAERREPARLELAHRVPRVRRALGRAAPSAYARGAGAGDEAARPRAGRGGGGAPRRAARRKRGGEKIARIRDEMNRAMEAGCGVYREQASMAQTVQGARGAQGALRATAASPTRARSSTPSWWRRSSSTTCSTSPRRSPSPPLARKESRGAHACSDFPTRNDAEFLHHSLVTRSADGRPVLGKKPVTLGDLGAGGAEVLMSGPADQDVRGDALRPGPRRGAAQRELRGPGSRRLEGPRRAQLHQGRARSRRSRTAGRAAWRCAGAAACR